ncbi:MAG: hypothetical protein AB7S65_11075 [Sulfuricurvum sp.]
MNIRKRAVFYIAGFDPRGVRHYYSLYKEHAARQSSINGIEMEVGPRRKVNQFMYQWNIVAEDNGQKAQTDYCFLAWDDIVRKQWSSGIVSYYLDLLYCIGFYILNGLVFSFAKSSPKQMMAAFYPVVYLLGSLFLSGYAASLLYHFFEGWLGVLSGLILFGITLRGLERFGNRIGVFWLLRIYAFSVRWAKGEVEEMEQRIDFFAKELAKAVHEHQSYDEILLVSHSVGTILSVSVLGRALADVKDGWEKFSMITLGECIPLMSFQPQAEGYRQELASIAQNDRIVWHDYTSPIDGACFPLHNFYKSVGIGDVHHQISFLSPRFHLLFDKIKYKKLRRDWYKTHFLYIMSTDRLGNYDYFAITAGTKSFRESI